MAGTISEDYLSRKFTVGQTNGRELVYHIVGTTSESDAQALLAGTAPATYLGLVLEDISADYEGGGKWKGYARYVRISGSDEYTFDTGGGSQRITQSLSTIASYAPSGMTAPDFEGAIGVSEDRVEGVDITVPAYQFTETHTFADAAVTTSYKTTLAGLTGTVNNATFRGFAAGECLFLGAAGSRRGDELWAITFRFACQPNATGLTVGSITGINKLGWDYLWVRYADYADNTAYCLVKRPIAAYVERVYRQTDFSGLGI